ncbi:MULTISPECIES: LysR substrate-binding domain-containing protein [unclassified Chelatococcus]|uniref:LysR substrate-binding domain-containing protein n=1 Tax=unclassified Chelatococcus TaxID=2638111 RepID=UPI001BD11108|nr:MULTISPECIES: LysR substrate-binding domain-containing protein [unclassified Chelatococcus]CAH1671001.1 HTH lysR-type domain-containing protein [Hyphomicrobiales bacterium]MBS7739130.1 LysR family transcriptional regulator [Chelatococcus sp. HY11]MBX3543620.1 LysR family transcriptional regulator [Chelatococcus sp.]MCO5076338.1 LysR substrate-binding domain-containing protein [Chelatococcus sp.]CAH1676794.1 HTH lysR-type domain-containing protein [Hyphomicrobiales bacterium]
MNIRFLRTFCVVADKGSLAAAARHLGLANASVAEQIRALEKTLDATLTVRRGQGIALTEAGQAVLGSARQIVAQADDLHQVAQAGSLRGRLRVGAISTALISLMPRALQRLADEHPDIEMKVVPGTSAGLLTMLDYGEIDCALAVRPPFKLPKTLSWQSVRNEPLVFVGPPSDPGLSIAARLRGAPFIRMDRNAWTGQIVSRFLADRKLELRELFELDAPETIVILAAEGLGVSLLPDWGIVPPVGRALDIGPVDDGRYGREVGIIGHRGPAEALIDAFGALLREPEPTMP